MLSSETKRKIDNARNILVGKIPTPTGQVEHITLALMYKFMNDMDTLSKELGGKAKFFTGPYRQYAWKNIMDPGTSAHERVVLYSQGLEKMSKNPALPLLFREIFKRAFLPFRDPEVLTLFLKQIDEFTYDHSEELGNAFEYLLSIMGTQGEAGQLRTPRHIIDFIVKVVDPKKTDRILDPACGTAGFLISAFKHIMAENAKKGSDKPGSNLTQAEKNRLPKNFVGYDISYDMVRLSLVNMYLHEFPDPKIYEYDTLTSEERWDDDFDCILANPPFMSPKGGIRPHRRFQIQANRSEVLFVDYIMEHLTPSGKAGVIVPEGIIFQSANAYKSLRKMLIEQNYLWAVVSLPAGVFNPYAGVKTSILLMDRTLAKKTQNILFVKVQNDGLDLGAQRMPIDKNDLPQALDILQHYKRHFEIQAGDEKLALVIPKSRIAEGGDYNLTGDRYKDSQSGQHNEWPFVELKHICMINEGSVEPEKVFGNEKFYYIDISSVENGSGKISLNNLIRGIDAPSRARRKVRNGDILLSTVRPNLKAFAYVDNIPENTIASTGFAVLTPTEQVDGRYLFYAIFNDHAVSQMIDRMGRGAYPSINQEDVKAIKIPLPPLEVQQHIVVELDGYQKMIDGAKQVIASYKPQIKIDPSWEMVRLGDFCDLQTGGTPSTKHPEYYGGNIKWLVSGDIHLGEIYDCKNRITEAGMNASNAKMLPTDSVLIALNGQGKTRGTVALLRAEATCNQSLVAMTIRDKNKLIPEFLYFHLKSRYSEIRALTGDNERSGLNMALIRELKTPLPPHETQKQIVAEIEEEQKLVKANKKLVEIFERKIKDKIDEVWGKDQTPQLKKEKHA